MTTGQEFDLLTKPEAAERLRVSVRTIDRYIHDGYVPVVRLGRTVRIRRADLDALINAFRPSAS